MDKQKRDQIDQAGNLLNPILSALVDGLLTGLRWTWRAGKWIGIWSWRFGVMMIHWTWFIMTWPFRMARQLFNALIGAPELTGDPRQDAIIRRVRRRFRRRNRFITHGFIFVGVNVFLWLAAFSGPWYPSNYGSMVGFSVAWLVMLVFHLVRWQMSEAEDRALAEELERARRYDLDARRLHLQEDQAKRKRGTPTHYEEELAFDVDERRFRLSDDGELIDDSDLDIEDEDYLYGRGSMR